MANRIKPLRRVGSTGQPNIVNMQEGEIAVNSFDQKIWMRVGNNLVEIANAGGSAAWGDVSDKPETATRWPTWEEITGLSDRLMFSPPSMNTDVYAYPWGNVSTGETPSDFPYGSGLVLSATLSHNRLLQFLSPSTGGSELPDVYLRSWHSTSGGGGWTGMYRLLHTGDMDPLNVLTTNTNNIKTDSRLRFTYASGVQLELVRTGGDGNSLMRFGAVGTDMYAGVGEPGSFAVGPDLDMTVAANRWFKVNANGAFVHENEVFHAGNFDPTSKFDTPSGTTAQYIRGDGSLAILPSSSAEWGSITGNILFQTDLKLQLDEKIDIGGAFNDAYSVVVEPPTYITNVGDMLPGQMLLFDTAQHTGLPSEITGTQEYVVETRLITATRLLRVYYQTARNTATIAGDGYGAVYTRAGTGPGTGVSASSWGAWSRVDGASGGSGTVTSVGLSVPTGFSVSNSPITASGNITLAYASGYRGYTNTEATKLSGIAANATVGAAWATNLTGIPANITAWAGITPSAKQDALGFTPVNPSLTITAGNGLSGGGTLAANRTITLGTPGAVTLSSTNSVATTSHTHAFTPGGTTSQYIRGDGSLATLPSAGTGTVTSVSGGNGLSGTVTSSGSLTLGTPSSITLSSTNSVATTSHTHSFAPGGTTSQYIRGNGSLATFPSIPSSSDYVATSGNQTGLSGNKTWTGIHNWSSTSATPNITTERTNNSVNSLYGAVTTAGAIYFGHGTANSFTIGNDVNQHTASNNWFRVNSSDAYVHNNLVYHAGNLAPSDYALAARSISAGNGLSGGGTLAANRTITLGTPGTLSGSTTNAVQTSSHTHALSTNLSAWDGVTVASKANSSDFTYLGSSSNGTYDSHFGSSNNFAYLFHAAGNQPTDAPFSPARQATVLHMGNNWGRVQLTISNETTPQVFVRGAEGGSWTTVWTSGNFTPGDYTPTSRTVTAGNGLSGGGSLASNRTITLGTPGTITGSSTNAVQTSGHTHALTLVAADIPNLAASQVTSGSFAAARIPNLNASKITAGTLPIARGGTGGTTKTTARNGIGIFVQSVDPGTSAAAGDLWVW